MIKHLVIVLVSFSLVFAPIKPAQAFVPAAALAGYIVTTGGTAYRIGQAGAALGAIALLLLSSDSQTDTRGRIGLQEDYEPVPRVSFTPTATKVYSPPPDYPGGCVWYRSGIINSTGGVSSNTTSSGIPCAQAWQFAVDYINTPNASVTPTHAGVKELPAVQGAMIHEIRANNGSTNYSTDTQQGYSYQPAPDRTVTDSLADVMLTRDQTGKIVFVPYTDDPDFQVEVDGGSSHPIQDPETGALTMYGVTSDGQQRSIQTVSNPDGTVDLIETTNNPDGTSVSIGRTTINPTTGSITSATTSTQTGRVTVPTTTTVETFPEPNPNPGTGTGTQGDITVNVQFPTDYARQFEAQQAAQLVVTELQNLSSTLTEASPEPMAPDTPEFEFFGDTFDELLAWQLPAHTGQCPVVSFEWEGNHTMDVHCDLIEDFRLDIDIAFVLLWSLLAMAIVLRA